MILLKNNWPKTENSIRYRLFAELAIELVHSDSWESYRCHTLSTIAKLQETSISCGKIIDRTVPKATIQSAIEEVNSAIISDPIVTRIIKEKNLFNIDLALKFSDPIEKILGRVKLLQDIISGKYKVSCEDAIKEICAKKRIQN